MNRTGLSKSDDYFNRWITQVPERVSNALYRCTDCNVETKANVRRCRICTRYAKLKARGYGY